jgi:hypothetical protein
MSDYEVTLVNDSMQEFYVWFYGPTESAHSHDTAPALCLHALTNVGPSSSILWWNLEDPCRTP